MSMKHSVLNRIVIGKSIGFLLGILIFFLAPLMGTEIDLKLGLGLLLFYVVMGSLIGFMGLFDRHPMFGFRMPFWFRGIALGLSMQLMLVLLIHDEIALMMSDMSMMGLTSPFWALIDGVIIGLIMEWAATKFAGEGKIPLS